MHYVIRSSRGDYWQASKGFVSSNARDATKYSTRDDARFVRGFCVHAKFNPEIVECEGDVRPALLPYKV